MEQRVAPIGTAAEVFGAFLRLGLTAFGGPVAHLGYFRADLVVRRGWLDEPAYAELVALCQFLPGPASSQAGLLLGLHRAGAAGALTAWAGFTLPSALVMLLLGLGAHALAGPLAAAALHGLKLVAVVIVAQAVWGMARSLAPDWRRRAVALAAGLLVLSAAARPCRVSPRRGRSRSRRWPGWHCAATCRSRLDAGCWRACRAAPGWSAWRCSPACWRRSRCWHRPGRAPSRCSGCSPAAARWCSAAVMWCCRCCATRWCRPAG